jgi:hypothetical protein
VFHSSATRRATEQCIALFGQTPWPSEFVSQARLSCPLVCAEPEAGPSQKYPASECPASQAQLIAQLHAQTARDQETIKELRAQQAADQQQIEKLERQHSFDAEGIDALQQQPILDAETIKQLRATVKAQQAEISGLKATLAQRQLKEAGATKAVAELQARRSITVTALNVSFCVEITHSSMNSLQSQHGHASMRSSEATGRVHQGDTLPVLHCRSTWEQFSSI